MAQSEFKEKERKLSVLSTSLYAPDTETVGIRASGLCYKHDTNKLFLAENKLSQI